MQKNKKNKLKILREKLLEKQIKNNDFFLIYIQIPVIGLVNLEELV